MYHYVYRIEHIETNEFYIGSRTSNVHPTLDSYLGSMKTWKPDKSKLKKIILKDDFESREDAIQFEANEISNVINEHLNRNYFIPGKKFCTQGFVTVRDNEGKCFNVKIDNPRYLSGELKHANKGTQLGKTIVIDSNNNVFKVFKDDSRIKSGELKIYNHLSIAYWTTKGYSEEDARKKIYEQQKKNHIYDNNFGVGEKNSQYGTKWICNKILKQNKKIKKYELIPLGWELGRKQKW